MTLGIFYKSKRTRNPQIFVAFDFEQWSRVIKHRGFGRGPLASRKVRDEEAKAVKVQSPFRHFGYYYENWDELIEDELRLGSPESFISQLQDLKRIWTIQPPPMDQKQPTLF